MKPILSRRRRVRSSSESDGDGLAVDADLAGSGPVEAADQVEQRRFAGARRTDDRDHLAALDVEVDGIERHDLAFAVEMLGDPGERDHPLLDDIARSGDSLPRAYLQAGAPVP